MKLEDRRLGEENSRFSYGGEPRLYQRYLRVRSGLLGPNGAGKTNYYSI